MQMIPTLEEMKKKVQMDGRGQRRWKNAPLQGVIIIYSQCLVNQLDVYEPTPESMKARTWEEVETEEDLYTEQVLKAPAQPEKIAPLVSNNELDQDYGDDDTEDLSDPLGIKGFTEMYSSF